MKHTSIAICMFLLLFPIAASGYESISVSNGGTLKGTVKIAGEVPSDETIQVTQDKDVCGETLPRQKYVIGSNRGVQYAVIFIENVKRGKPVPKTEVVVDNKKCAFQPHVQSGVVGQTLVVKNDDPMLHNTHMYIKKRTLFNSALPIQGMEIKRKIKRAGLADVQCDIHNFMQGYLYIADHPYITVTDEKGNFTLSDIPPGTYEVEVWHEALGQQEHEVTINPNKTTTLAVEFEK